MIANVVALLAVATSVAFASNLGGLGCGNNFPVLSSSPLSGLNSFPVNSASSFSGRVVSGFSSPMTSSQMVVSRAMSSPMTSGFSGSLSAIPTHVSVDAGVIPSGTGCNNNFGSNSPIFSSQVLPSQLASSQMVSSPLVSSQMVSSPLVSSQMISSPLVSSQISSGSLSSGCTGTLSAVPTHVSIDAGVIPSGNNFVSGSVNNGLNGACGLY